MNRDDFASDDPNGISENSRALIDDQSAPFAKMICAVHFLAMIFVAGWNYFVIPAAKRRLDQIDVELSNLSKILINFSDLVVNYWYVLVVILPSVIVIDFLVMRWVGKEIGVIFQIILACLATMAILAPVACTFAALP